MSRLNGIAVSVVATLACFTNMGCQQESSIEEELVSQSLMLAYDVYSARLREKAHGVWTETPFYGGTANVRCMEWKSPPPAPWDPRPYAYGRWPQLFDGNGKFTISGGTFDPEGKVLCPSLGPGVGQRATYDRPPVILAYRISL